jgi:hypothetical protein
MSRNTIILLIYHHHKLLDLITFVADSQQINQEYVISRVKISSLHTEVLKI